MTATQAKGVRLRMIDKSVPYFDVVMVCDGALPVPPAPALPDGFRYHMYAPGDIAAWSAVEAAVDEFDDEVQARAHFQKEFMPHEAALRERMVFILGPDGQAVADAAAWWGEDAALGGRFAMLHWVAVRPDAQGKGLGRAVSARAMACFPRLGPSGDIWLTTQTWSHVAIGLYLSLGFCAHRTATPSGHRNGFEGALPVLEGVMPPDVYAALVNTAVG